MLVEKIKQLCQDRQITFAELERKTGISNGQIRRWSTVSPKSETLQKVADYFQVSIDYLLGRTENPELETTNIDNEYEDLVVMFRKNEMEIPESERPLYRKEVEKLMEFVKFTMKELDEKNK